MTTHDPIPARLAALKTTPTPDLKQQWRDLFDSEPPPFNRRYLESRLAYRIQELAYGGLKPETIRRLERLGEELDGGDKKKRGMRADRDRPITGTRLCANGRASSTSSPSPQTASNGRGGPTSRCPPSPAPSPARAGTAGSSSASRTTGGGHDEAARKIEIVRKLRCAVYTRKSSEEGLEQEFNSLHAQREACEAYIASQRSEGWVLVRDQYDDGGISGGTLERPGLKRLLADIEDGLVDVVVVYKIDRLSRSLADFAKLVEVFDRNGVTFVSVTQSFNTTTSMGRLTLNILLSFAQFEREVTAERIRDKVAASRKKGMWMGGVPPFGYRVENRKLVVDEETAAHVRWIFARFLEIGSCTVLAREVGTRGLRTPRGNRIDKKYSTGCCQPRLHRRGGPQGRQLSRRARRHHRPRDMGPRPRHPAGEPAQARRAHPRRHARAAEGAAVRARWRRVLADAHPQGRQALPLLCQPDGAEARRGGVPGRPRARGRDRGGGHRPAPRRVPPARDRGGDMEGGADAGRRTSPRPTLARPCRSSIRCGTNCSRRSRRALWPCWSSGSISAQRSQRPPAHGRPGGARARNHRRCGSEA
jgi:DNA invertase Pin-like site-specific DNA recombinase